VSAPAGGPRITAADLPRLERSLQGRPGRAAEPEEPVREAAVALVLRSGRGASGASVETEPLELLFIKRAEYEGDPWSGHVAFPGGRHEAGDPSLEHTARRETLEELALDLAADGRLLGVLDDLHPRTPVLPPIVVRPFVYALERDVLLSPSAEVAIAFWVPVAELMRPDAKVSSTVRARERELLVPSFRHDGHVIWGMTERIIMTLLDHLRPDA
jgi:8-oxo-dGTP pyrophosphatase MutT (NUDIX family)